MHLALGGPRTDRAPTDQVRNVLGREDVKVLDARGHAGVVQIAKEATRDAQSLVDVEPAVEIGVVDQPLPPHRGARLLEVHPHDDEKRVGQGAAVVEQPGRVLPRRNGIVNGAGPGDDQEAIVLAGQNPVNRAAGLVDPPGHRFGDRHLLEQLRRGRNVVDF